MSKKIKTLGSKIARGNSAQFFVEKLFTKIKNIRLSAVA